MTKYLVEYQPPQPGYASPQEVIEADGYSSGDGMLRFFNLEPWIMENGKQVVPIEGSKGFPNVHTSLVMAHIKKVRKLEQE